MGHELRWTERAKKLVAYHKEAREFVSRASQHLDTSPSDALAVSRLWLEAEQFDALVCSLLDEMKSDLLGGDAELDTTRGASARPVGLEQERVFYECSWSLVWGPGYGVSFNLAIDPVSASYEALVLALKSGHVQRVRFPISGPELKEALIDAYVVEATLSS